MTATETVYASTAAEVRSELKKCRKVFVWFTPYPGMDGEWIEVTKKALIKAAALEPNDGAHGGVADGTHMRAERINDVLFFGR